VREQRAIELALDLTRMPALAPILRTQPLPFDILDAIRIAAGCSEASESAHVSTQEPLDVIQCAATLYLQEALFFPGASPHRNLGVAPGASRAQMRLHMRWLLRWLHPDHNSDEMASLLAVRVIKAWREIGQRNWPAGAAETKQEPPVLGGSRHKAPRHRSTLRLRWIPVPIPRAPSIGRRKYFVRIVLAGAAALALIFLSDAILFGRLRFSNLKIAGLATLTTDRIGETGTTPQ
jgi:hypothetical protein